MATLADLMIKIGADSTGLSQELNKSKEALNQTFSVSPVKEFSGSVDEVAGKISGLTGNLTKLAGIAAGGFGLNAVVQSAVNAAQWSEIGIRTEALKARPSVFQLGDSEMPVVLRVAVTEKLHFSFRRNHRLGCAVKVHVHPHPVLPVLGFAAHLIESRRDAEGAAEGNEEDIP